MNASSIIGEVLRSWDIPTAIEQAVSRAKHDRAPKSVQRLTQDAVAIAGNPPFRWPEGEVVLVGGRGRTGKSFMLEQHMRALMAQGYSVQFTQTIEDPGTIRAIREGEVREWSVVEPKLMLKPPMRRDYWGEAFASMYRRHSGPVDPDE